MKNQIALINEESLDGLIFEIRGQKVMLDYDLARIYGYDTKAFNQQVKRNAERFPADFYFRVNKQEFDQILMSQIVTARKWTVGNIRDDDIDFVVRRAVAEDIPALTLAKTISIGELARRYGDMHSDKVFDLEDYKMYPLNNYLDE